MSNLNFVRSRGIGNYVEKQKSRIELLQRMLSDYDDGRSKSFYCLAAALLPVDRLEAALARVQRTLEMGGWADKKLRAKNLARLLRGIASEVQVDLELRSNKS